MSRALTVTVLFMFVFLLLLCSCATVSQIESSWKVPSYMGRQFSKLAVIAVMKNRDESKAFEMAAVANLSKVGIDAVPGFTFLGSDTLVPQDELEKRVETTGADGVLIFKTIAVDKSKVYIPPTSYAIGTELPYGDWWDDPYWGYYTPYPYHYWGYWYPAVQVVGTPGYWTTEYNYQVETALYRTSDNKLIWTAMSGTYDPRSQSDLGASLSAAVIAKLQADGLISGKTKRL